MLEARLASEKDLETVKEIWNYCFGDTEKFTTYYFRNRYIKENNVVVENNGKILSSLQLSPYKLCLNGKTYNTSYVVGVSTLPDARGKGCMKAMINFSLQELYRRGELVSILMPIDYRIYGRYGFENCYDVLKYEMDVDELRNFKMKGDFHKYAEGDIDKLIELSEIFQKHANGYTIRDESYFKNLVGEIESDETDLYILDSGRADGYLIYKISDGVMNVREIMYRNMEALKSIMGFIYNHNTQCKKVEITAPVYDKLIHFLENPRDIDIKLEPFITGRVIDVKGYLESITIEDKSFKGSVIIVITDNQIYENNGVFEIKAEAGRLIVEKLKYMSKEDLIAKLEDTNSYEDTIGLGDIHNRDKDAEVLKFTINMFSKLAFSYRDIIEILYLMGYEADDNRNIVKFFKTVFPKKINFFNDYI
ncbi:MAG: GNAT family N-acetyltransferase [Clostridioides sp.]|jgi:predicted acetyltransferase|nr:GNAT family N-acetyltransferase [Clostridioides sp.]